MPINRESQITVLRSIGGNIPDGLTFGEFGFAGANRQLFIGGTGGEATVQSIWIGASITGTDIVGINNSGIWPNEQDSQYTLSTTKAVKKYIDDTVGTAGVVTSVNGNIGAITITGAGNNAAIVVRNVVAGTHNIDARLATASLTGVASFNPQYFTVGANGAVTLAQGTTFTVRGSDGSFDMVGLTGFLTLTGAGGGALRINAGAADGNNDTIVTFDPRIATASLTGIASFPSSFFTVSATGAVNLASAYQVTGHTVVQGGPSQLVTTVGNTTTIDNRVATASVTGVASFDNNFSVTNTGVVSLATDVSIVGNLTVGGDVVTVNVSTFTVEDPLIKLGSNNGSNVKDLGFYVQYGNGTLGNNDRYAGIFRDASDLGKFKFFEGLTNSAEMGISGMSAAGLVQTDRQGYTMATVVAKLDGGTF